MNIPPTLTTDRVGGGLDTKDSAFLDAPYRDHLGNIAIDFETAYTGELRGAKVTPPLDNAGRWMYIASQGVWYSSKPCC